MLEQLELAQSSITDPYSHHTRLQLIQEMKHKETEVADLQKALETKEVNCIWYIQVILQLELSYLIFIGRASHSTGKSCTLSTSNFSAPKSNQGTCKDSILELRDLLQ